MPLRRALSFHRQLQYVIELLENEPLEKPAEALLSPFDHECECAYPRSPLWRSQHTEKVRIEDGAVMVGSNGLEPSTSSVSGRRSNQLSYEPTGNRYGFAGRFSTVPEKSTRYI